VGSADRSSAADAGQPAGWLALLRAINLGPRNKVPMAGLRELFERLGCESVRTYIQSGNVLFESRASDCTALARRLESAVAEAFGVSSAVVLRTFGELREVAGSHPFGAGVEKTHVAFLANEPDPEGVRRLLALDVAPDRFELRGADLFLHYPNGVQGARLTGSLLERSLGVAGTVRTWRTVTRLAELAAG
jgi:uncharacterized protein (DUF1697 family)